MVCVCVCQLVCVGGVELFVVLHGSVLRDCRIYHTHNRTETTTAATTGGVTPVFGCHSVVVCVIVVM